MEVERKKGMEGQSEGREEGGSNEGPLEKPAPIYKTLRYKTDEGLKMVLAIVETTNQAKRLKKQSCMLGAMGELLMSESMSLWSVCLPVILFIITELMFVMFEIRLIIFFAAKDGEALYSQQKQDQELTVAQTMNSLLPNSDWNWRK